MTFDLFISHILYRNDDDDFDLFDWPVKHCVGGEEQSYRLIPLQIVAATTFIGHSLNRDGFVDDKSVIPMILLKGVELQRGFLRINSQSPSHRRIEDQSQYIGGYCHLQHEYSYRGSFLSSLTEKIELFATINQDLAPNTDKTTHSHMNY